MILDDLNWLGISYKFIISQSSRLEIYKEVARELKNKELIYPCYETPEELNFKRKILLLDEPTSALSVRETERVLQYVTAVSYTHLTLPTNREV